MTACERFTNPVADTSPIEQSKLEELIDLQSTILGATVTSNNYEDLLKQVCLFAEKLTPDAVASIMLFDKAKNKLFVHAAPSIPIEAIIELDGLSVGDGSCGNAVFHNKDMFVCNTLTDDRWENLRDFANQFKIHACWSSPIKDTAEEPIGSFAISSFDKRTPDNFQRRLLNSCASIAGIIIQREYTLEKSRADNKKLLDSQQQYRTLVNNSGDGIFLHRLNGEILDVNQAACDSLGYSRDELLTLSIFDFDENLQNSKSTKAFTEGLNFDETVTIEGVHNSRDNTSFPVEVRIRKFMSNNEPLIVALVRDIRDRKKHEEDILRARKLDSIGLLAGGIAHDFNNLLGIIQGYIDLAHRSVQQPEKTEKYLIKATNASIQAAHLTQQLLTFSKGGEPIKTATNITDVITQSTDFSLHGSNVDVNYSFPDDLWIADIDSGQISQVIQNLVINARQAMHEGGMLCITCENCVVTDNDIPIKNTQNKYIRVTLKDTGRGISKEIIESIFDPYFTTKEQGSGLGLALSYSIISKHNGNITVSSKLGEGTTFTLYLPTSNETTISTKPVVATESKPMKKARIMVMDDDEMLREVSEEMLQNLGYDVIQSTDGNSALAQYKQAINSDEPIDLIIMDLTIPNGIGGKEAIKLIQQFDPNAKALVCSGYCNDPVMARHNDFGFTGAVKKPYSQDELEAAVSTALQM